MPSRNQGGSDGRETKGRPLPRQSRPRSHPDWSAFWMPSGCLLDACWMPSGCLLDACWMDGRMRHETTPTVALTAIHATVVLPLSPSLSLSPSPGGGGGSPRRRLSVLVLINHHQSRGLRGVILTCLQGDRVRESARAGTPVLVPKLSLGTLIFHGEKAGIARDTRIPSAAEFCIELSLVG